MSLPEWVKRSSPWDSHDDGSKVLEALSIALDAMTSARRWGNLAGMTAEAALTQVEIDLAGAMRRIKDIGVEELPGQFGNSDLKDGD
jgi:hypothetical protein